jgi:uracil-DNA glycosylase
VDDGLVLRDCFISASARCAPPGNRPLPVELRRCEGYLDAEWGLLNRKRVILALGKIAWDAATRLCERQGMEFDRQPFAHGAIVKVAPSLRLLGSYHVSQQNTFTGKLTPAMFDEILRVARHR